MDEPGDINNSLFQYVRAFIKDEQRVKELEEAYSKGDNIGDGHVKVEVAAAISELLEPIQERRAKYEGKDGDDLIVDVIREGIRRSTPVAEQTLELAKEAM